MLRSLGVSHGFTTRSGGVSPAPRDALNLARRPDSQDRDLTENWTRVSNALGGQPDQVVLVDQVHGAAVVVAEVGTGPLATLAPADGLVTRRSGLVLAVRTADCVPVLFSAPGGVGAAHAGWRGAAAGVVEATALALAELVGCPLSALVASVGPCISGARYEVGEEVVQAMEASGVAAERFVVEGAGPKPHVDVGAAVMAQLERLSIRADRIQACTASRADLYSHRADGPLTGRQAGVIRCP